MEDQETVSCDLCGAQTPMTATKRCERCWELETRIMCDPVLAERILGRVKYIRSQQKRAQIGHSGNAKDS